MLLLNNYKEGGKGKMRKELESGDHLGLCPARLSFSPLAGALDKLLPFPGHLSPPPQSPGHAQTEDRPLLAWWLEHFRGKAA